MSEYTFIAIIEIFSLLSNLGSIKPAEKSNYTYTYNELISEYEDLDREYSNAKLLEVGPSDIGKPIHLFVLSNEEKFSPEEVKNSGKRIVFINNGIHPGEACGINASLDLAKKLLHKKTELNKMLDSVVVLIVPVYNVGGILKRNKYSRVSQNGPKEYGFRGNAKNLDLNRDFIKCDTKNAKTFNKIFREWDPDIFVDTHTTNGSDHSYTLTLIATQKDKLNPVLSEFLYGDMLGSLYNGMEHRDKTMIPYVYPLSKDPADGIKAFLETPRYSSGYTALFDCIGFITEAHSYKPFDDRVEHTKAFLEELIIYTASNNSKIKEVREKARAHTVAQRMFPLQWTLDSTKVSQLNFKGYTYQNRYSDLLEDSIRYYDRESPFEKEIDYYLTYKSKVEVTLPSVYIIPQAYENIVELLDLNQINYERLEKDERINVEAYYIENIKSPKRPYEGHFLHSQIEVRKQNESIQFYQGDILVSTNQLGVRYIVETLEPQSDDSFLAWNFYDSHLQQKEWFSDFSFEPKAKEILATNDSLRTAFNLKKEEDKAFRESAFAQLYYIYKNSKYYEPTVNRYPIYRFR